MSVMDEDDGHGEQVYRQTIAVVPQSQSTQRLVNDDSSMQDDPDSLVITTIIRGDERGRGLHRLRAYVAVLILFVINLLNYMDRFTITGVLIEVQRYFSINNAYAGALQTVFICSYMVFAPLFGYLGDRYDRRYIMASGLTAWVLAVFCSSFVPPNHFWLFMVLRGVVGIGEASYVTVAPTIIADLFAGKHRSQMLMMFYFAIPVGTGLGFIVGSNVADWTDDWRWGVRVTPILGVICLVLIVLVLPEPERGLADQVTVDINTQHHSIFSDLKYLATNRSYVYSSIGFTFIVFVVGSMSWWTPNLVMYSYGMSGIHVDDSLQAHVSLVFGVISVISGLLGVFLGSTWATYWKKTNGAADALVCAYSAMAAVPFMFVALAFMQYSMMLGWVCIFLGITLMCFNWSVIMDMLLYIVTPNRRATAGAFQILSSHLFGDAFSPYLIGQLSTAMEAEDESYASKFKALQTALYIPNFVLIGAGAFLLLSSFFVIEDKMRVDAYTHALNNSKKADDDGQDNTSAVVVDGVDNEGVVNDQDD